jgi:endoglucanase
MWQELADADRRRVSAANMGWNGALGTNASTSVGFVGAWSGANPVPTSFSLNGTACTGSVTTPTPGPTTATPATPPPPGGPAPALRVKGNRLLTASGATYRLLGVNRASGEFAWVQNKGVWDSGPVDQASVNAMKAWNIRAVRIPLNEDCWLGLSGSPSGATTNRP